MKLLDSLCLGFYFYTFYSTIFSTDFVSIFFLTDDDALTGVFSSAIDVWIVSIITEQLFFIWLIDSSSNTLALAKSLLKKMAIFSSFYSACN